MRKLIMAAESGDAGAQFNLGVAFANRGDIEPEAARHNRMESARWLLMAARQGLPRAQIMLAERLAADAAAGSGVKAAAWFLVAATVATGIHRATAQEGYERIRRRLTTAQVARAEHLARLWKPKKRRVRAAPKPAVTKPAAPAGAATAH